MVYFRKVEVTAEETSLDMCFDPEVLENQLHRTM